MSNVTIRDAYIAAIKATLQFAADQDMLSFNPAVGIRVRVKDNLQERDKGFSGEEARIILAAIRQGQRRDGSCASVGPLDLCLHGGEGE